MFRTSIIRVVVSVASLVALPVAATVTATTLADRLETPKCALPLVARLFRCRTDTFFPPLRKLADPRKLILKNHPYLCRTLQVSHDGAWHQRLLRSRRAKHRRWL